MPEPKEKTGKILVGNKEKVIDRTGQLEDKTGQLERKLLLRQFITKALEIKRAEIVDVAEPDESDLLSPTSTITSSPGSISNTPQKLTFYDVVQLARQQALAERTWKSSEDLIDLSDTPELMLNSESSINLQNDLCLLDSSSVMDFQQIDFSPVSQNEPGTFKPSEAVEITSTQSVSPEFDMIVTQKSFGMDLLEPVDPKASQADELRITESREQLASTTTPPINYVKSALASYECGTKETPVAFESVGPEISPADDSKYTQETKDFSNSHPTSSIHQFSTELINQEIDIKKTPAMPGHAGPEVSQSDGSNSQEISEMFSSWTSLDKFSLPIYQISVPPIGHENDIKKTSALEPTHSEVCQEDGSKTHEISDPFPQSSSLSQPNLSFHQSNGTQEDDTTEKSFTLKPVDSKISQADDLEKQEISSISLLPTSLNLPILPIHQSRGALVGQEYNTDEVPAGNSLTSSAVPSIFSHSSTLSSATGLTLPGITEEDVQARNFSAHTSLKLSPKSPSSMARRKVLGLAKSSISEIPSPAGDTEICESSSTSYAPPVYAESELPSNPQRTKSVDGVSLSPLLPLISNLDEPDEQGFPWIVQAARDGNEEMIQKLLVSGADIRALHTTTQRHALSEASIQGHHKIVDLLIDEGCPVEHPDAEGYTALHYACQRGHLTVAKSLITNNAPIDAPGPRGQTALHLAMQPPPRQSVVMLLIQHKANVNARDATFQTPLHIGASQGNVAMCNYLLNEGAQLDSREVHSKTPLQLACEAGHYELVQMLLNQSNLNPTNMSFLAAFFAAVEYGHVQIAESFFPRGLKLRELRNDSHKSITIAAKGGGLAMVELMINENCDINARDENGWNALHFSSYYGHYQVIERLISSGVSTDAITSRKETPLLFAVKRDHFAVAERLLRCTNVSNLASAEDERNQQPIHHTARTGSVEIFNLLMSNGAKINGENSFGWQPLHIATAYGHFALVQRLLQEGANIEEKLGLSSIKKDQTHKIVEDGYWAEARWPYTGSRPLHLACEYGHYQIASHLISKGAKMEVTCSEGWQPLHHATYTGSSIMVEMLLESGVYPHATTNEGKTAHGLPFCTSGVPILEEEKDRIRNMLEEAMNRTRKQKSFKVPLKRGSTVEEKNKLVRAATFSMDRVSRSHTQRVMSTIPTSDPSLAHSPLASRMHRPQFQHLPYTSPLPLTRSDSMPTSQSLATPRLSAPQMERQSATPPTVSSSNLENTDTVALDALTADNATNQLPPLSNTNTSEPPNGSNTESQISAQRPTKPKRRTTFGLSKGIKPGIDIGKLGLGSIGKQTFEIGKQTFDIGKQTLELGKQGIEMGKQGLEKGKQGFERGKQGLELKKQGLEMRGKQSFDKSRQTYKLAKTFAKKGKWRSGKIESEAEVTKGNLLKDSSNSMDADNDIDEKMCDELDNDMEEKAKSFANNDDEHDEDGKDDDENESILDDAGSVFSMGGLDENYSDKFEKL